MLNSFFCCKVPKTEKSETIVDILSSTQQNHSPGLKHESTKEKEKEKEKEKIKEKEKSKKIPSKKKEEPEKIFSTQISFSNFKEGNFEEEKSPQAKKLLLTGELFFNKELIITHYGLINSRRKKNDNQTFFGITEGNDYTGTPYNDFIINLQN